MAAQLSWFQQLLKYQQQQKPLEAQQTAAPTSTPSFSTAFTRVSSSTHNRSMSLAPTVNSNTPAHINSQLMSRLANASNKNGIKTHHHNATTSSIRNSMPNVMSPAFRPLSSSNVKPNYSHVPLLIHNDSPNTKILLASMVQFDKLLQNPFLINNISLETKATRKDKEEEEEVVDPIVLTLQKQVVLLTQSASIVRSRNEDTTTTTTIIDNNAKRIKR